MGPPIYGPPVQALNPYGMQSMYDEQADFQVLKKLRLKWIELSKK